MSLIESLKQLQREHGHLSDQTLRDLSTTAGVPLHAIQAVVSFYPHFRTTVPPKTRVAVCRDMACHLAGAEGLCENLKQALGEPDQPVHAVSCLGQCDVAPAVAINDEPVCGADVAAVLDVAAGRKQPETSKRAGPVPAWPHTAHGGPDEHYGVIKRLLAGETIDVVGILKASGLKGMGGAAFPTGVKWQLVAEQAEPLKHVICNADESEPGTFKDRAILENLPHLVVEAMAIAGRVVGAQHGHVFIRHEYERQRDIVAAELDRARRLGILNDGFDVQITTSPVGYILGEETALLECMEGKRGEPRNKPPFPGQVGLHGKPTLINNVETFAAAAAILNRGADWWNRIGKKGCQGFKFVSVSGHVRHPGVYQIPMGTTVKELIDLAGGVEGGKRLKAFAPGGASSNFLPAAKANVPIDFEQLAKAGSMLGSGALFVVAEGTDMLELATNVVRFFRNESCGKCVPCRLGSEKAVQMLDQILTRGGQRAELSLLNDLADTMNQTSICGLGQVALNPVLSVAEHFPQDLEKHMTKE